MSNLVRIRQRRAYATRHTFATVALMGGVRPAYVAEQMGHTSTRMFFEVYARWINGADKGLQRSMMAQAFSGNKPPSRSAESIM
jgi:integrase